MAEARAGNEQISMRAAGSESGRRRTSKVTPSNQVHTVHTVLGKRSNRGAWSFCLRLRTLWGPVRVREMPRHRARQKNTPMKRETVEAVLASEDLALVSVSARTTSVSYSSS